MRHLPFALPPHGGSIGGLFPWPSERKAIGWPHDPYLHFPGPCPYGTMAFHGTLVCYLLSGICDFFSHGLRSVPRCRNRSRCTSAGPAGGLRRVPATPSQSCSSGGSVYGTRPMDPPWPLPACLRAKARRVAVGLAAAGIGLCAASCSPRAGREAPPSDTAPPTVTATAPSVRDAMNETTCGQSTIEIRNGRPVICLDGAPVSQAPRRDLLPDLRR